MTSITFRISGETNDTESNLVTTSPYSRLRKPKNGKRIYVELTRDLESDCDVTISVTCRIYSTTNDTISIFDIGVDFTIFKAKELENDKIIYVYLVRDLESDCDVTNLVTCSISSNTDATDSILVSILPYSRPRNSKMIKLFMNNSRVT